jgi:flavin reductase (DIM6/NTAB) family NADH-FMN oxidoreductase RutF
MFKFLKKKAELGFSELTTKDNFYQTSSFFPMPIVLVSTLSPEGTTNLGPYSLCFPFHIAERDYYSMMLIARSDSNTAENILRTKICALNFISDRRKHIKECVRLGFPGEKTEVKMKDTFFTLIDGKRKAEQPNEQFPQVVNEAVQVFECTWDDTDVIECKKEDGLFLPPFNVANGATSPNGTHFILRVDKILLKERWRKSIINGTGRFPRLPIDYGFRDNTRFWISSHSKPYPVPLPKKEGIQVDIIKNFADNINPNITWETEAYRTLSKIPRVFLKKALHIILKEAEARGIKHITPELLQELRSKHNKEN